MSVFNPERAALVLLDALLMGDQAASEKWQVTDRTIQNYRARLESDHNFSALFLAKRTAADADWRVVRLRFLRRSIAKLEQLVALADEPKHIKAVSEAVRVIGELQIASDALSVDPDDHQPGDGPAPDAPGGPPGGEPADAVH